MTDTTALSAPRKRGRPKGSKNRPKTLASFISKAITEPYAPPEPKPAGPKPRKKGGKGIWDKLKTPEERSAYAKKIRAKVTPEGLKRSGRKLHTPNGWDAQSYAAAKKRAKRDAKAFAEKLDAAGHLPSDPIARFCILECLELMRTPGSRNLTLACAKTLLEYLVPKPAKKTALQLKSESGAAWLDALARQEEAEPANA